MGLDEHGTVSGLVTVIDLIEEIIGELSDEFDVDPLRYKKFVREFLCLMQLCL
ncbi:MAG: hypothetical protein Ct9H90mP2_12450 [Dehalococcoidia bacterium]|nr:MAG: hypothetical protein Ct9H90mP2_12450 [Dehalococcoidia bacterium]